MSNLSEKNDLTATRIFSCQIFSSCGKNNRWGYFFPFRFGEWRWKEEFHWQRLRRCKCFVLRPYPIYQLKSLVFNNRRPDSNRFNLFEEMSWPERFRTAENFLWSILLKLVCSLQRKSSIKTKVSTRWKNPFRAQQIWLVPV